MRAARPLVTLALLFACGCGRWQPATPREIAFADPRVAFEATVSVLRGRGYAILELDPQRGFLRTQSMVDGDTRIMGGFGTIGFEQRVSHLLFQVQGNGRIVVTAVGYHVRDGLMHYKLADEIDELVKAIAAAVPHA